MVALTFFKVEMSLLDIPSLKMRQVGYVGKSGTKHPVAWRHVPEQRRPNQSVIKKVHCYVPFSIRVMYT
jgi:hypothetical protein